MSIKHMSHVWDTAPYSGVRLLVLLALADSADKDTGHCYPSVKGLAQRARLKSARHVYEHLDALEQAGWISRERHPGRRSQYIVHMPAELSTPSTTSDAGVTSDFASPVSPGSHRGDARVTGGVTPASPLVTVTKPSFNLERERAGARIHTRARETLFPSTQQNNGSSTSVKPVKPVKPVPAAAAAAWRAARERIMRAPGLGGAEYATWIAPLRITALDTAAGEWAVTLLAPSSDHARIVNERYGDLLASAFAARVGLNHASMRVTIVSEAKAVTA